MSGNSSIVAQSVELVLSGGVDTKTDPKLVPVGKLAALENFAFEGGTLQRRPGSRRIYVPEDFPAGNFKPGNDTMLGTRGDQLVMRDKFRLWPFSEEFGRLSPSGIFKGSPTTPVPPPSLLLSSRTVASSKRRQDFVDTATVGGLTIVTWKETSLTAIEGFAYVADEEGSVLVPAQAFATALVQGPRACAFADRVGVLYSDSSGLVLRTATLANPTTLGIATILDTGVWRGMDTALRPDGNLAVLALQVSGSAHLLKLMKVSPDGVVLSAATIKTITTTALETADAYTSISISNSGKIFCFYKQENGSSQMTLRAFVRDFGHASVVDDTEIVPGVADYLVGRIGSARHSEGSSAIVAVERTHGPSSVSGVKMIKVSEELVVLTEVSIEQSRLLSNPFYVGDGPACVSVGYSDWVGFDVPALEPTVFVHDENGFVVARTSIGYLYPQIYGTPSEVGGVTRGCGVSVTTENGVPRVRLVICERTGISSGAASNIAQLDLSRDVVGGDRLVPIQYGGNLYLPGAIPRQFDGVSLSEVGFNRFNGSWSVAVNTGSGAFPLGSYQLTYIYEWTDASGELHQSAPALPATLSVSGSASGFTWHLHTLRRTDKMGGPVTIVPYRTQKDGTIFYRVPTNVTDTGKLLIENSESVESISFVDEVDDGTLGRAERLYTTGGVAENVPMPPCRHLSVHDGRLVAAGTDRGVVAFSTKLISGIAPRFHDTFVVQPRPDGDDVVATGSMDGRLILLKRKSIEYTVGDGPNELGSGGGFDEPKWVTSATGCKSPQSVILTPEGLMFHGARGIYLLRRDLGLEYVGADVEGFVGVVTGALHSAERSEVRFIQSGNSASTLVYNYLYKQWSVNAPRSLSSAVSWKRSIAWTRTSDISARSSIFKNDATAESDDGEAIESMLETPWVKVGGLMGFQRVWWWTLLGTVRGNCNLTIKIAYDEKIGLDGQPLWFETVRKHTSDLNINPGDTLELRLKPKRQKCRAIKFQVICDGGGEDPSFGMDLTAIVLEMGVKKGLFKLSSLKTLGRPQGSAGS